METFSLQGIKKNTTRNITVLFFPFQLFKAIEFILFRSNQNESPGSQNTLTSLDTDISNNDDSTDLLLDDVVSSSSQQKSLKIVVIACITFAIFIPLLIAGATFIILPKKHQKMPTSSNDTKSTISTRLCSNKDRSKCHD